MIQTLLRRRSAALLCCALSYACMAPAPALAVSRPHISGQLYGVTAGKPTLTISLEWVSARIQSVILALPDGLSFNRRAINPRLVKNGKLTERFDKPGVTAFTVQIPVGQLRESAQLRHRVRSGKLHSLTFMLWVKQGKGKTVGLKLKIRSRKTVWSS